MVDFGLEMAKKRTFEGGINATFIDVETTGLNFRTDHIIEIALVKVRNSEPVAVFNSLVRYDGELDPKVTQLTGHTTADVNNAPFTLENIALIADEFIEDDTIIAYNAPFDLSFMETLWLRAGDGHYDYSHRFDWVDQVGTLNSNFIDPLTIARDRSSYPHKLGDMCRKMGIVLDDAHSAYHDCFALVDLAVKMHQEKDISEYLNLVKYKVKYGEPEWQSARMKLEPLQEKVHDVTPKSAPKANTLQQRQQLAQANQAKPKVVMSNKAKKVPMGVVDASTLPRTDDHPQG